MASYSWEYFPHVNPAQYSLSGFFNEAMARQGMGGLWFAGEVFGFGLTIDTYEQAHAFAAWMVNNKL